LAAACWALICWSICSRSSSESCTWGAPQVQQKTREPSSSRCRTVWQREQMRGVTTLKGSRGLAA
jgi:hypothetical protein